MQSSRARTENLWRDYFREPSHWLDYRKQKRNPRAADFKKKLSQECLWIDSWYTPGWVKRKLLSEDAIQREEKEEDEGEDEVESLKGSINIEEGSWLTLPQPSHDELAFTSTKCKKTQENALMIDAYMKRRGSKSHKMLGNDLASLCVDMGCTHHVQEGSMHSKEASFHVVIHGYVKHNMHGRALIMYDRMQMVHYMHRCICPRTFVALLKSCSEVKDLQRGRELHCRIEGLGLLKENAFIGSSLIRMYSSCGCLMEAHNVLDTSQAQDVVMWTSMIGGYCMHEYHTKAFECFEQMQAKGFSPNVVTFISILKACAHAGAMERIEEIVMKIEIKGWLEKEFFLGCALIDMYVRCGCFATAWEVSHKISIQKNIVTWNTLLSGFSDHGLNEEALKCFEQMQCEGTMGNPITFVGCMKACGSMRAINKGKAIHALIESLDLPGGDIVVGNALIGMYSKFGAPDLAGSAFDKLRDRDVVSWTTIIDGYADHGEGHSAIKCYEQMRLDNVTPNPVTYVCGLKACGSIGITDKGIEIHSEIEKKGWLLERNAMVGNALLDMYTKGGLFSSAQKLFDKLQHHDHVSWNILIGGHVHLGEIENAFHGFHSMQTNGIRPDYITFVILMKACSQARLYSNSQTYFNIMSKDYGILPSIKHYTCMVDLLGRDGRLDKALQMIKKSPLLPNLVTWRTMLSACRYWGNVELGKHVFEYAERGASSSKFIGL